MDTKELLTGNEDKAVLEAIQLRKKDRHTMDVRQFHDYIRRRAQEENNTKVLNLSLEAVVKYLEKLEKAGLGQLQKDDKGILRFHTSYRFSSMVPFIEGKGELKPFESKPGTVWPKGKQNAKPRAKLPKLASVHSIKRKPKVVAPSQLVKERFAVISLRPNMIVKIDLPADFQVSDIEMINKTLRAAIA